MSGTSATIDICVCELDVCVCVLRLIHISHVRHVSMCVCVCVENDEASHENRILSPIIFRGSLRRRNGQLLLQGILL